MARKGKREKIYNIPNFLTFIRLVITLIIIYLAFVKASILTIVIFFVVGMFTDFLDGQIARRYNQVTKFGANFDMIADRILMIVTMLMILLFYLPQEGLDEQIKQVIIIMTREIISLPFAIAAVISRAPMVKAKFIGKLTTFMQGFAFPITLLSANYAFFSFAPYLAIATGIVGIISGATYAKDFVESIKHRKKK